MSSLFAFVHDPDRKITNAAGFEADLYSDSDEFPVRVVVASLFDLGGLESCLTGHRSRLAGVITRIG
jgi:hypothetical protein